IFSFQVSPSWPMRMARRWLTPLIPGLMRIGAARRFMFRAISQIAFAYRESPISAGSAGRVRGGDRLPWFQLANGAANHGCLGDLDWQVHVYGEAPKSLETCCMRHGLALRQFPWNQAARAAGFEHNALYLVRPDGHVGLVAPKEDVSALEHYLSCLD